MLKQARKFLQNKAGPARPNHFSPLAFFGFFVLALLAFVALFAPILAPFELTHMDVTRQLEGPSADHWLGTDENGADVFTLLLYGARVAAIVGISVVSICASIGILLGAVAGYFGGVIDELLMRATDILMAFPGILLAILIIFITQEPSLVAVILALSVSGWAGYARLVRGQVLQIRDEPYIEAAKSLGLPVHRILVRHVIPNSLAPVIIQATFGVAGSILAEAALSFLGLGPQDMTSWGALLDQGASYFLLTPHLAIFPGLAIMFTVLSINFVGDGLRDVLDPRKLSEN